jgi:hypothetical protein
MFGRLSPRSLPAALALVLAAALPVIGLTAANAADALPGTGTVADPYLIGSVAGLDAAAALANGDSDCSGAAAASYRLTADIDYGGGTFADFTTKFCGVFEGNGHTISNLVNTATVTGTTDTSALFYALNGAVVKDLSLDGITTVPPGQSGSFSYPMAALAATATSSTITGIALTGSTVSATSGSTGAIIAGLVNSASGTEASPSTISDNYVSGTAVTGMKYAGGLVGTVGSYVTVANNYMSAAVTQTVSGAGITATMLVRSITGTAGVVVSHNVIASGSITRAFGSSAYTGGWISGTAAGTGRTISNNLVNANNNINKAADPTLVLTASPIVVPASWPYGNSFALTWSGNHPYSYSGCTGTADPLTGSKCWTIGDNGTATDPAALAAQATYDGLGWDFTDTWAWDATVQHPVLLRAPVVSTSTQSISVPQGSTLDAAALKTKTDASIDDGTLSVDLAGIDTATLGVQTAYLTGTSHGFTTVLPITVTVVAATVPILTVPTTTISVAAGTMPTQAEILLATGATTDAGTLEVDFGSLSAADFATPGATQTVHITATHNGNSSAPVAVTVKVGLAGAGTPAHPYLIASRADLDYAASTINADVARSGAAIEHYALTADLDYGGGTFGGFGWFGGVLDGAGHTISNLVNPTSTVTAPVTSMFTAVAGTVENLVLDHVDSNVTCVGGATYYASALVDTLAGGTVQGVELIDSSVVMTTGACATNSFTGALVRQTTGAATIANNLVWDVVAGGNKYSSGLVAAIVTGTTVKNNLVSATIYQPTSGSGATADGIVVQGGGTVTGNVLYGGSVTAGTPGAIASGGTHTIGAIGGWSSTFDDSTDLVSSNAAIHPSGNGNNATPLNGTATSAADLAKQSTYEQVGWDFDNGITPWAWDTALERPVLRKAPLLQLTGTTAFGYQAGHESAADAKADILAASSPTIDQGVSPSFAVDLTGVDLDTVGSYLASVTATDGGTAATARPVTINVINPAGLVVDVLNSTIDLNAGDTITSAELLIRSGATAERGELSANASDLAAVNSAAAASTEGSYPVRLSTTVQGVAGTPTTVHVKVVAAGAPVIKVTSTEQSHVAGDAITANNGELVLTAAGATATDGTSVTVGFPAGFDEDVPGVATATLTAGSATPVSIRITVTAVPKPVITVAHTSVSYHAGESPSKADLLTALGAEITQAADGATLDLDLADANFDAAGSYTVQVTGSWRGAAATPVDVTINVLLPGSGTSADPYLIGTASDLDAAAALVNQDTAHSGAAKATIRVTADIDYGGHTFAGFVWFGGTFDGAGHTISNIDYATTTDTKPITAMFITMPGTIQDLALSGVTSNVTCVGGATNYNGGIVDTLSGTLARVALVDSSVVMTKGACATNSFTGGLARTATSTGTITDSMLWNTTVTGNKYAGGIASSGTGKFTHNLVKAEISQTTSGAGAGAGGIQASGVPSLAKDNVVFDGSVNGTGTHTAAAIGPESVSGTPLGTDNLVSTNVLLTGGTDAATPDNGTAASPEALAKQSAYDGLGWEFGASSPWSWVDAGAASHPILTYLPIDFSAPFVALASPAVMVSAQGAEPSTAELLTAFGAADDHGTLSLDLGDSSDDSGGGVNFQLPGSYPVTVVGSDHGVSTRLRATIVITALVGSGTEADPLEIGSRADLDNAVGNMNSGPASYQGADYVLTANINYGGDDFVGIDRFSGAFDGAGHTISNLTYTANSAGGSAAEVLAFFRVLNGATVANLSLNDVQAAGSDNVGGLAGDVLASTIEDDSVLAATLTSTGGDVGGLVGGTASSGSAIHDNEVLDTAVTGPWVVGGAVATAKDAVTISDNLVDVQASETSVAAPGHGNSAGGVLGAVGTGGATVAVSGNVLLGGGVAYGTGGARTGYVGYIIGDVAGVWTEADDLVSADAVLDSHLSGGPADVAQGNQDGTSATPAELATQSTYEGLDWDLAHTWAWDSGKKRPTLAAVAELTVPSVSLSSSSVVYQVGHVPDPSQILTDLGASMTPSGTLSLDLGGADLTQTGTYTVAASGQSNNVGSRAIAVQIKVLPVVAISTAVTRVEYVADSTVGEAQFLADVGAALNTAGTLDTDLSEVDLGTPGSYPVTITASDTFGFAAEPVAVTVAVVAAPAGPGTGDPGSTVTPGNVTIQISGPARVGTLLTADAGTWTPAGTPAYQWLSGGDPISGATAATYTPVAADAGHLVQVKVTEQPSGGSAVSAVSLPITVSAGQFVAPNPVITGTPKVGQTLRAGTGTWSPAPEALGYQWLRNGIPIATATSASYVLQKSDAGAQLRVQVYGVSTGYATALVASGVVKVAPIVVLKTLRHTRPKIRGTVRVGRRLHVVVGSWKPNPRLHYQWLVAGKRVSGATKATFKLPRSAKGKKVTVRVTATLTGYRSVTVASVATGRVK